MLDGDAKESNINYIYTLIDNYKWDLSFKTFSFLAKKIED